MFLKDIKQIIKYLSINLTKHVKTYRKKIIKSRKLPVSRLSCKELASHRVVLKTSQKLNRL